MDQLETRELAYFVAVAEEGHFGRAAQRLGIAQPPLSRAIKQLERRLGVVLLERTNRGAVPTPAGTVLLQEARTVLDAAAAAVARTRRAGQRPQRLVLIVKPGADGGLLPAILAAYEREPEAVPVDIRGCGIGEQAGLLRAGVGDVALMHGHRHDLAGLESTQLLVEPQVLVLPAGHRLAGSATVHLADLQNETTVTVRPAPDLGAPDLGAAEPGAAGAAGADGPAGAAGAPARDAAELLQLIALGRGVAVLPASVRGQLRRDLACVPVADAAPTPVILAWPEHHRSRSLAAFVRTAEAVAAGARTPDGSGRGAAANGGGEVHDFTATGPTATGPKDAQRWRAHP